MCGRYSLKTPANILAEHFQLKKTPSLNPRYNIAPAQPIAIIRLRSLQNGRELALLRWGLIPSWAKDPGIGNKMIIARAETVSEKPAFREAFARSRCLIPADGYYEWQRQGRMGQRKQPFYIRRKDKRLFAFAGLWEQWRGPEGKAVETCAILTTEPSQSLTEIHDRMPVILDPKDYEQWLDPYIRQAELLQPLLCPYPEDALTAYPVSLRVNDPAHDDAACTEPL